MLASRKLIQPTSIFPITNFLQRQSIESSVRCLSISGVSFSDEDESLQENPFYEKYEGKIRRAKAAGVYMPKAKQYNKRLQEEANVWRKNIEKMESKLTDKRKGEDKIRGLKLPSHLDELIKIDLLIDKSGDEISKIWSEYWSGKECVSAVVPQSVFDTMVPRIKDFPLFLYPLPRQQGYEFFLSQFSENHCFYTSLINYQVHGEDAPWQLCFKFYPELKDSKKIVLMVTEFDRNAMSILEVQCLAQLQQLFYATPSDKRHELMVNFNKNPDNFKYMDVVKEIESGDIIVKLNE